MTVSGELELNQNRHQIVNMRITVVLFVDGFLNRRNIMLKLILLLLLQVVSPLAFLNQLVR